MIDIQVIREFLTKLGFVLASIFVQKFGAILAAVVCGVLVFQCQRAMTMEGVVEYSKLLLRNAWPKILQLLQVIREQGLILAVLLGLSAFFSMAETSITTLWPRKIRHPIFMSSSFSLASVVSCNPGNKYNFCWVFLCLLPKFLGAPVIFVNFLLVKAIDRSPSALSVLLI